MKNRILLFIATILVSCSSDTLENLNQNIKDPAQVPGESLFTGAEKNLVDQIVTQNVNYNNTKLWVQYWQETTYTDESRYDQVTRTIPQNHWDVMYKDVLKDLDEATQVISTATYLPEEATLTPNKLTVLEIVKIYTYSNLVETFGDIPYTEALDIDNLLPEYDDGLTVYQDLISRLTAAINALDVTKGSFGSADNLYGGDTALWLKFAASLKLRMGILLSDVEPALAQQTVEEAVATGVFTSNADNADFTYYSADPNTNPVHANLVLSGRHDYVAAVTITDMMNSLNDPRLPLFFLETDEGEYIGGEIGSISPYADYSHVSAQVEAATTPGDILDYAEVEFLLAEAVERGYTVGGTAKEHYDAGITASFAYWGATAAEAAAYLDQPEVDYDTAIAASNADTPWKEVIGKQKWLALYNRGFEAWTSIRLLDYPIMAVPEKPESGYPSRYTYPITEQTLNGANYKAAASAIGGDTAENNLFWDLN